MLIHLNLGGSAFADTKLREPPRGYFPKEIFPKELPAAGIQTKFVLSPRIEY